MSRLLAFVAFAVLAVTACTIQLDLPGNDDDDGDGPRSGFFPCPGCTDGGTPEGVPDGGYPWWESDAGPHNDGGYNHSDAGCDDDADGGHWYPDAGPDNW